MFQISIDLPSPILQISPYFKTSVPSIIDLQISEGELPGLLIGEIFLDHNTLAPKDCDSLNWNRLGNIFDKNFLPLEVVISPSILSPYSSICPSKT
jgi:hypothetical protein